MRSPAFPHSAVEFFTTVAIGGLVSLMGFMSAIGDLLPIALCRRTTMHRFRCKGEASRASEKVQG